MHDVDLLPQKDVAEVGKGHEYARQSRLLVDRKKWHVVDLHTTREISNALSVPVPVRHDHHFVAT